MHRRLAALLVLPSLPPCTVIPAKNVTTGGTPHEIGSSLKLARGACSHHSYTLKGGKDENLPPDAGNSTVLVSLLLRDGRTVGFLRRCIEEKLVVDGILLRGPAGSGKSALMKVPVHKWRRHLRISCFEEPCDSHHCCGVLTALKYKFSVLDRVIVERFQPSGSRAIRS